jgi:hypothetical protein
LTREPPSSRVAPMDINQMIESEVRTRVAAELRRLLTMVEGRSSKPVKKPGKRSGRPVTEVAREELSRGARTFGELWTAVEKAGGSKFALKSALGKGRERGEFAFDGTTYALKGAPKRKKPSPGGKGTPNAGVVTP